ncbi:MAG: hypothetical protein K2P81_10075 [Bacteriovoracaceae bacterium]|nr:hypothetical protein [Bacteriovoracaceae bacterium]
MTKPNQLNQRILLQKWILNDVSSWNPFAIYGVAYALMGLATPLVVQMLVSNLAFSGLGINLISLSILITLGLTLMQFCRLGQTYILEYIERKIIDQNLNRFPPLALKNKIMFFELATIPKVLSKWAIDGFEIFLSLVVTSAVLMVYHPYFVLLNIVVWLSLYAVYLLGKEGIQTSLEESNQKYKEWFKIEDGIETTSNNWLGARHEHFKILKNQIILLSLIQTIGSLSLLIGGAWLFNTNQISLGQFVAAELLGGGLFYSLGRLSKFMETHYSLITSLIKLEKAFGGGHE